MLIAIHQSHYLPWLGYIDKIDRADRFVVLDDVQFEKNDWQNRNRILSPQGWQWLTVPIIHKFGQRINDVKICSHSNWQKKHLHALSTNYSKADYFKKYWPIFKEIYSKKWKMLCNLNIHCIGF